MLVKVFKCQMCGHQFEREVLDRDDPEERHRQGTPLRCPECGRAEIEVVRTLRRTKS